MIIFYKISPILPILIYFLFFTNLTIFYQISDLRSFVAISNCCNLFVFPVKSVLPKSQVWQKNCVFQLWLCMNWEYHKNLTKPKNYIQFLSWHSGTNSDRLSLLPSSAVSPVTLKQIVTDSVSGFPAVFTKETATRQSQIRWLKSNLMM